MAHTTIITVQFDSMSNQFVNFTPLYFRHQRLFLLNDSADQSIHFQAMILGEHSDFEVRSASFSKITRL